MSVSTRDFSMSWSESVRCTSLGSGVTYVLVGLGERVARHDVRLEITTRIGMGEKRGQGGEESKAWGDFKLSAVRPAYLPDEPHQFFWTRQNALRPLRHSANHNCTLPPVFGVTPLDFLVEEPESPWFQGARWVARGKPFHSRGAKVIPIFP